MRAEAPLKRSAFQRSTVDLNRASETDNQSQSEETSRTRSEEIEDTPETTPKEAEVSQSDPGEATPNEANDTQSPTFELDEIDLGAHGSCQVSPKDYHHQDTLQKTLWLWMKSETCNRLTQVIVNLHAVYARPYIDEKYMYVVWSSKRPVLYAKLKNSRNTQWKPESCQVLSTQTWERSWDESCLNPR